MDFLALVVIAEFDEYFYSAVKSDPLCKIVTGEGAFENFLIIQRTTSVQARNFVDNNDDSINELKPQPCEEDFVDKSKIKNEKLKASLHIRNESKNLVKAM